MTSMFGMTPEIRSLIDGALAEDHVFEDVTTGSLVPPDIKGRAVLKAEGEGVLAGAEVALAVFRRTDRTLNTESLLADGAPLWPGDCIARIEGKVGSILRAERTALNFLQHLSGIATQTARYVKAIRGSNAAIVDTRKTVPGLRALEKYAVTIGGGHNHRMNLQDEVLIKDNHIAALRTQRLGLTDVVGKALENSPHSVRVEVEVTSPEEAMAALEAGAHVLMLDNMCIPEMRRAVELVDGRAVIEASGGITLANVRQVAETGVDRISVGALTHSVRALDISLDLEVASDPA